jgi:hypothetical protein
LACTSFGQQGQDLLWYLWLIADRHEEQKCSGLVPSFLSYMLSAQSLPLHQFQLSRPVGLDFIARLYCQSVYKVLIAIHEAITEHVLGKNHYPDVIEY